jgi:hypothetical protein
MAVKRKKLAPLPQTITIKRNEDQPESMELVAKAVLDIDAGFKRMMNSGVSRDLIVLLLHDMTKVGKPHIRAILSAAPKIADTYIKK